MLDQDQPSILRLTGGLLLLLLLHTALAVSQAELRDQLAAP